MKIRLIEGTHHTEVGERCVKSQEHGCYVVGYVLVKGGAFSEEPILHNEIVVVKQDRRVDTFRTFCHEFFHWFLIKVGAPLEWHGRFDAWSLKRRRRRRDKRRKRNEAVSKG
jgi:hypothetical protein